MLRIWNATCCSPKWMFSFSVGSRAKLGSIHFRVSDEETLGSVPAFHHCSLEYPSEIGRKNQRRTHHRMTSDSSRARARLICTTWWFAKSKRSIHANNWRRNLLEWSKNPLVSDRDTLSLVNVDFLLCIDQRRTREWDRFSLYRSFSRRCPSFVSGQHWRNASGVDP